MTIKLVYENEHWLKTICFCEYMEIAAWKEIRLSDHWGTFYYADGSIFARIGAPGIVASALSINTTVEMAWWKVQTDLCSFSWNWRSGKDVDAWIELIDITRLTFTFFIYVQFFWKRRNILAKPLLREGNIGAVLLENPYYGLRKPKEQV